jgi:hypothetical protein
VTQVSRQQIAEDLDQLAKISDCVRTYAIDHGLDQIPELAAKVWHKKKKAALRRPLKSNVVLRKVSYRTVRYANVSRNEHCHYAA